LAEWDPVDFAKKIVHLIENPSLAKQFGNEARQLAISKYDWKLLIKDLEAFYFKVLNDGTEIH